MVYLELSRGLCQYCKCLSLLIICVCSWAFDLHQFALFLSSSFLLSIVNDFFPSGNKGLECSWEGPLVFRERARAARRFSQLCPKSIILKFIIDNIQKTKTSSNVLEDGQT